MRNLTLDEISRIVRQHPDANPTAVTNFLQTIDPGLSYAAHMLNVRLDKNLYNWKPATVKAIQAGLTYAATTRAEASA